MRKVVIVLLAITLVLGGLGGFAYANTHEAMVGQKLIGYGPFGYNPSNEEEVYYTLFTITNPDCERDINVERVSIIRADGEVLYEGQPFTTLQPHSVNWIRLVDFLGVDAGDIDCRFYTVEILWDAHSKCLPLTGHVVVFQKNYFDDGTFAMAKTRVPMESMKQRD